MTERRGRQQTEQDHRAHREAAGGPGDGRAEPDDAEHDELVAWIRDVGARLAEADLDAPWRR